jgi:UDP-glucose 4-epimerase
VVDSSKLHQELSWEPKIELSEGLKRTVDYFRERMN